MIIHGAKFVDGSTLENAAIKSGDTFPDNANIGELFYKTGTGVGLNVYDGTAWAVVGTGGGGGTTTDPTQALIVSASDETTALDVGLVTKFRFPYNFSLSNVKASLSTAQASGSTLTIDIEFNSTSIFTTPITIDNTETTSSTATAVPALSKFIFSEDDELEISVTQVGASGAAGLKLYFVGEKIDAVDGPVRFWRFTDITTSGGYLEISELQIFDAQGRISTATISSTVPPSAGTVDLLNDNNLGTRCYWPETTVETPGFAIIFDCVTAKDVIGFKQGGWDEANRRIISATLQNSTNGTNWTTIHSFADLTYPGNFTLSDLITIA